MSLEINTEDFWKEIDKRVVEHRIEKKLMSEEITKLREQLAAQASEIESLRISYDAACMLVAQMHEAAMGEVIGPYHGVVEDVRTKVAAQAAVIEKFKRAIGDWDRAETPSELQSAESGLLKALSIPTDSTQILDEVRRAERERVEKMILDELFDSTLRRNLITKIRAME